MATFARNARPEESMNLMRWLNPPGDKKNMIGRCIHWSGVGCTFPDPNAALTDLEQEEGYYDGICSRKNGAGCSADGHFEVVA